MLTESVAFPFGANHLGSIFLLCLVISWQSTATVANSATDGSIRTIVLSGDAAPGTSGAYGFDRATSPVINNAGEVAFAGYVYGEGVNDSTNQGVWVGEDDLTLIAGPGVPVPGADSNTFSQIYTPNLNDVGEVAFRATLADGDTRIGIWSSGGGEGLALVARRGEHAPGTNDEITFLRFGQPLFNNAGLTAFVAELGGDVSENDDYGIWAEKPGSGLTLIAREGNPAPNAGGAVFCYLEQASALNQAGQVAFHSILSGPGISDANDRGIWSERDGQLNLIAREGDRAPGTANRFQFVGYPVLNDAEHTAFRGFLEGSDDFSSGIWSEGRGDGLRLVAREGGPAPGTNSGVTFNGLGDPLLNKQGLAAFSAGLKGDGIVANLNDGGIFAEREDDSLRLVARLGSPAPGTDKLFSGLSRVHFNGAGQIAVKGGLSNTGERYSSDQGIWAEDRSGALRLLVRVGDTLDVDNDPLTEDYRMIESLDLVSERYYVGVPINGESTGNGDGRHSAFNDLGQLTFWANFTDGSRGAFVSNLVAVPEPGTLLVALSASAITIAFLLRSRPGCEDFDCH